MTAIGVARPRAHGQEMMRTVTVAMTPVARAPAIHHPTKVMAATRRTAGTNTWQTRSATR